MTLTPVIKTITEQPLISRLLDMTNAQAFQWLAAALLQTPGTQAWRQGSLLHVHRALGGAIGFTVLSYPGGSGTGAEAISAHVSSLVGSALTGAVASEFYGARAGDRVVKISTTGTADIILIWIYDEDNPPPGSGPVATA